jgi:small conductance mechanosensitive channel
MFWQDLWAELRGQLLTPERLAGYILRAVQVVIVIAAALLVYLLARRIVRRLLRDAHERRARTLVTLVHSIIGYTVLFVAAILVLRALGVDYAAILAGAGVVGLAVGFGAQTLIRDFISGFFLLLEDLAVESVGLRITRIRAFDGTLHVIPNGELTRFGNANRKFMRAVVTVDLAYEQDAAKGMATAKEVVDAWCAEHADVVVEPPLVQGLLSLGENGVRIRIVVKVKPMQHWQAEQELRLRLKQAFGETGIEIPYPRRVVVTRNEAKG